MIPRTMMINEVRRVFALAIAGFGLGSMIVIVDSMFWPNLALAATSDPYGPEPTGIDAPKRRRVLTERAGERRPEDQFQFDVFGRALTIGGEVEIRGRYRDNPRIDPTRDHPAEMGVIIYQAYCSNFLGHSISDRPIRINRSLIIHRAIRLGLPSSPAMARRTLHIDPSCFGEIEA